jgi:hypothetical protein
VVIGCGSAVGGAPRSKCTNCLRSMDLRLSSLALSHNFHNFAASAPALQRARRHKSAHSDSGALMLLHGAARGRIVIMRLECAAFMGGTGAEKHHPSTAHNGREAASMPTSRVACNLGLILRAFMVAGRPGCAVSLGLNGSARGNGPAILCRRGRNTERRHR